eukprot:c8331_g1_i1.p1 GENE.c8331_g1_i1~~c8331_g1_i1.p1  ORF type:complete len:225 (+),score=63.59 c8331_g1_i1:147-821(+)
MTIKMDLTSIKCVTVGDGAVGKTSLLISFSRNEFPTEYVPTVFDNHCANMFIDNKAYRVGLWDTAGQEAYDKLRNLSYPGTNVFLVCYSINSRVSFENVETKWVPEIRQYSSAPIVLVGTKFDQRTKTTTNNQSMVSTAEGFDLAQKIGACGFVECSALTRENLTQVFETAVKAACGISQPDTNTTATTINKLKCLLRAHNINDNKNITARAQPQYGLIHWRTK